MHLEKSTWQFIYQEYIYKFVKINKKIIPQICFQINSKGALYVAGALGMWITGLEATVQRPDPILLRQNGGNIRHEHWMSFRFTTALEFIHS